MPQPKTRPVSAEEVKISRDGDSALFVYADESMGGGMNLNIGPQVATMTDDELLERHNEIAYSVQGMRLAIVPDDETHLIHDIRIMNSREA